MCRFFYILGFLLQSLTLYVPTYQVPSVFCSSVKRLRYKNIRT